jgi:hypothetical protein
MNTTQGAREATTRKGLRDEGRTPSPSDHVRLVLATLLAGAGIIHLAVVGGHFAEYWVFGTFFLLVTLLQVVQAVLVMSRPSHRLFTNIWVTNLAVIGLWIVSRTSGVPIGPEPWMREMVGYTDAICAGFEAVAVVLSLSLAAPRAGLDLATRLRPATAGAVALGVAPLTLVALRFAGMA